MNKVILMVLQVVYFPMYWLLLESIKKKNFDKVTKSIKDLNKVNAFILIVNAFSQSINRSSNSLLSK